MCIGRDNKACKTHNWAEQVMCAFAKFVPITTVTQMPIIIHDNEHVAFYQGAKRALRCGKFSKLMGTYPVPHRTYRLFEIESQMINLRCLRQRLLDICRRCMYILLVHARGKLKQDVTTNTT